MFSEVSARRRLAEVPNAGDFLQSASNASDITATTIPPANSKESVILIRLEPDNYTTVVTGADHGTGIALVQVYEIDRD